MNRPTGNHLVYVTDLRVVRVVRCTRTGNVGLTFRWEVAGVPGRGEPLGMTIYTTPEQVTRRVAPYTGSADVLGQEIRQPRDKCERLVIGRWYLN